MVGIDTFSSLDIRIGRIMNVEDHEGARKPMYKLTIFFGDEVGSRTVVAGIKDKYRKEELIDKKIACIINLDPKVIAGIESQGMILAAGEEDVAILVPDRDMKEGSRVH
ncbi:MAG: tRNA-binding protein [Candidatus Marsarchaeota archaeon]|nr:tRNA-binding protein [Candidatus Marsarchaeota archaeon]MCL5413477.1 tRNA-binding protein [Candidatus Marsarchaeota archaeon]